MINFGGPFTLNLVREIIMIIFTMMKREILMIPVIILCFISVAYNLILYASVVQGVDYIKHNYQNTCAKDILIIQRHC